MIYLHFDVHFHVQHYFILFSTNSALLRAYHRHAQNFTVPSRFLLSYKCAMKKCNFNNCKKIFFRYKIDIKIECVSISIEIRKEIV